MNILFFEVSFSNFEFLPCQIKTFSVLFLCHTIFAGICPHPAIAPGDTHPELKTRHRNAQGPGRKQGQKPLQKYEKNNFSDCFKIVFRPFQTIFGLVCFVLWRRRPTRRDVVFVIVVVMATIIVTFVVHVGVDACWSSLKFLWKRNNHFRGKNCAGSLKVISRHKEAVSTFYWTFDRR